MASLNQIRREDPKPTEARPIATTLRAAIDEHEPVASPAHELHRQLHDAGYRSEAFRPRPMSNAMLVLTVICVYVMSMMMLLQAISA